MASTTVFELPEFKPYEARFMARLSKFARLRRYCDGTIYDDSSFKLAHKLYAETKSLLSFLARAVDLDVALVPGVMGAWALEEGTPEAIVKAQAQLYEWSKWPIVGDEWLEDGATLGEAMLKIVPDEVNRTITMQRLKPELCMLAEQHMDSETSESVALALIIDRSAIDEEGKPYEYAEIITPRQIRTYKNGAPQGYAGNPDRYDNPLRFVPVLSVKNDSGCRPTFAKTLPQLDSVNELASFLANIIGRHAEPQWVIAGADQGELQKGGSNAWFLPAGAQAEALLAQVDVPGTLEFVRELKMETKSNLPELAFDDLRSKAQIATETLEIQLVELNAKIWKMRRRYDSTLIDAHRMAAMAGLMMRIPGLETLLDPHKLDESRPVRPISAQEQIALEQSKLALEMQKSISAGDAMTGLVTSGAQDAPAQVDNQADNNA